MEGSNRQCLFTFYHWRQVGTPRRSSDDRDGCMQDMCSSSQNHGFTCKTICNSVLFAGNTFNPPGVQFTYFSGRELFDCSPSRGGQIGPREEEKIISGHLEPSTQEDQDAPFKQVRTRKTHLNAIFDHLPLLLHHNKVTPFSSHHHAVHLESESPPATPSTPDLPPPPSRLRSAAAAFEERRCRHRQLPQLPPPPLLPDLLPTVPLYWFRFRGEHTAWNVEEKLPKMDKGFEDAKSVIAALKSKGISSIGPAGYYWGGKVNSGQIAPLDEIIKLKEQYKFRVLLDESNSFGVLGSSGRGLTEHYRVPQTRKEIGAQYAKHLTESELSEFSKATEGFSGRDIRNVCQQVERHWASKSWVFQYQGDTSCEWKIKLLPSLQQHSTNVGMSGSWNPLLCTSFAILWAVNWDHDGFRTKRVMTEELAKIVAKMAPTHGEQLRVEEAREMSRTKLSTREVNREDPLIEDKRTLVREIDNACETNTMI
nr:cell division control protein 48 isoform X2 [Ipomoea trifida]